MTADMQSNRTTGDQTPPTPTKVNPLPICAYCRFWEPVFMHTDFDPDDPGECTGQIGKWSMLNGMWMKAADNCDRWQVSPARAHQFFDWIPPELYAAYTDRGSPVISSPGSTQGIVS